MSSSIAAHHRPDVPDAVRARSEAANAAILALASGTPLGEGNNAQPPGGGGTSPVVGEAGGGSASLSAPQEVIYGSESTFAPPVTSPPPSATPPSSIPSGDSPPNGESLDAMRERLARAEQDAKTWKGRFEATTAREQEARARLEADLAELRTRVETQESAKNASTLAFEAADLTQDERDQMGDDLIRIITKQVRAELRPIVDSIQADIARRLADISKPIESLEQDVAQTRKTTQLGTFMAALREQIPNFDVVNTDAAFLTWLGGEDLLSGEIRQTLLDRATSTLDVPRTVTFFRAYLNQTGGSGSQGGQGGPNGGGDGTGSSPAPIQPSAPSLADFASPGRSASSAAPVGAPGGAQNRVWTPQSVAKFFADVRAGLFAGKPVEKAALEADIYAAQREGRMRA